MEEWLMYFNEKSKGAHVVGAYWKRMFVLVFMLAVIAGGVVYGVGYDDLYGDGVVYGDMYGK